MSERDLKNLGDLGGDLPQGLRSGRQREGSQLSSTPMNSDANGLRPRPELSQLRVPQPLNRLPDEENLWQSPMGQGFGTTLIREARRSNDYYLDKYNVESDLEKLKEKVERYGLDLHNELNWTTLIVYKHKELKNEIEKFKTYLIMATQLDYMIPVENLLKELLDYKDSLEQRAIKEAQDQVLQYKDQFLDFQDKLAVATEEIALLKYTVAKVDSNYAKLSSGLDAVTHARRLEARDNTIADCLDIQTAADPPTLPRVQADEIRLPHVANGNIMDASGRPQDMAKPTTVARDLGRVETGPGSEGHLMIISGRSGRDLLSTSKGSGSVTLCPRSQGENQGQSQSVNHHCQSSSSIRDVSSNYQSHMSLSTSHNVHDMIILDGEMDVNELDGMDCNPSHQLLQDAGPRIEGRHHTAHRQITQHQDNDLPCVSNSRSMSVRTRGSISNSPPRQRKRDNSATKNAAEGKLRRRMGGIKKIIDNNHLNLKTPEAEVKDAVIRLVPSLNEMLDSCESAIDKYSEFSGIDDELLSMVSDIIEEAEVWKDKAESLYKSAEIYDTNTGSRLDIVVKPFSGMGEQTIYAFLRDFENSFRGQGNDAKKVNKLYNHLLSNKVKFQASKMARNYLGLKEWLIERYGNPVIIVDALISKMEQMPKITGANPVKKAEHFMTLDFLLKEIDEVSDEPGVDKDAYKEHLHSQPIMKRIIDLIPYDDKLVFSKLLKTKGCDNKLVRGEAAFSILRNFVDDEADAYDSNTPDVGQEELVKAKPRPATVAVVAQEEPAAPPQRTVHAVKGDRPDQGRSMRTQSQQSNTGWYDPSLKFPCPIDGHRHEVAGCVQFFSSTPKQRRDFGSRKICFICMGPMDKCGRKKINNKWTTVCQNAKKAAPLACKACDAYCQSSGISSSPFSMIMCQDAAHTKPTPEEVGRALQDYWPSFNPSNVVDSMVLCVGSVHNTVSKLPPCIKSSRPRDDPFQVVFDTETGSSKKVGIEDVPQKGESPSIYVMQWLKIGDSKVLCFFDSGANIHMISGELAEREKIRVISQNPTVLKVVGGGEVVTDYGTYQLNISTNADSEYQSFICHGLTDVAGPFDKHSLEEINSELRASQEYKSLNGASLPQYVGGSRVDLLLGIHAQALPVFLFKLPSGISVFKSPFTDIFGSRICFGGTHESFKKSATMSGVSHAVHFMSALSKTQSVMSCAVETVLQSINDELLPGKSYCDPVHHADTPSPLKEHGFVDSDDAVVSLNTLDISSGVFHMSSSVHKAVVPIARLRNLESSDDSTQNMPQCYSYSEVCAGSLGTRTRQSFDMNGVMQHIFNHWGSLCYLGHEFGIVRWLKKMFFIFLTMELFLWQKKVLFYFSDIIIVGILFCHVAMVSVTRKTIDGFKEQCGSGSGFFSVQKNPIFYSSDTNIQLGSGFGRVYKTLYYLLKTIYNICDSSTMINLYLTRFRSFAELTRTAVSGNEAFGYLKRVITVDIQWLKSTAVFFVNIFSEIFFLGFNIVVAVDISCHSAVTIQKTYALLGIFFNRQRKKSDFYLRDIIIVGKLCHNSMIKVQCFMLRSVMILLEVHFNIGSGMKVSFEHYKLSIKNNACGCNLCLTRCVSSVELRRKAIRMRSFITTWTKEVRAKEFVVALDNKEKFKTFRADFWRRYGEDQNDLHTGVVSFDTKSVPCKLYNLARIASNPGKWMLLDGNKGDTSDISSENMPDKSGKGVNFTTKLMFGSSDWVHLISFNVKRGLDGKSHVYACEVPRYQESQEEKLKRFVGDVEFISLHPLVSFRDAEEHTDGGRKAKGRAKTHPSSAYNPAGGAAEVFWQRVEAKVTFATQDEWEEYVPRRLRCPFSNPYEEDDEELATSPVLGMDLDD